MQAQLPSQAHSIRQKGFRQQDQEKLCQSLVHHAPLAAARGGQSCSERSVRGVNSLQAALERCGERLVLGNARNRHRLREG